MKTLQPFIIGIAALGWALVAWQWLGGGTAAPPAQKRETPGSAQNVAEERSSDATKGHIVPTPLRKPWQASTSIPGMHLKVSKGTLQEVVVEISRQSGVAIALGDDMPNPIVEAAFRDLPVAEALQRLFAGYDAFFLHEKSDGKPARLSAVWVYPAGEGRQLAPVPWPEESECESFSRGVDDPDALNRALAVGTLAERHGSAAAEVVMTGLEDEDERVRMEALQAAIYTPVEVPAESLMEMIQYDPSEIIRSIALDGLFKYGERGRISPDALREILDIAQRDADPVVSDLAAHFSVSWNPIAQESADSTTQDPAGTPRPEPWMLNEGFDPD